MRKPAGVLLAALVLGLMALGGLLLGLLLLTVSLFSSSLVSSGPSPLAVGPVRAMMILTSALLLAFSGFCAATLVALLRLRPWARYAILLIGGLQFAFSALACAGTYVARASMLSLPRGAHPVRMDSVLLFITAFYATLSLIGVWWLAYFNLRSVRAAFCRTPAALVGEDGLLSPALALPAPPSGWRLLIMAWASVLLIGTLFCLPAAFLHLPVFLFGGILHGPAATALFLALAAIELYLGIGILRRWKAAWYAALAFQLYSAAVLVPMLLPGMAARLAAYQQETSASWHLSRHAGDTAAALNMGPLMAFSAAVGLALSALITAALLRRKDDYLHRARV